MDSDIFPDLEKRLQFQQADILVRRCAGMVLCREESSLHGAFEKWEKTHKASVTTISCHCMYQQDAKKSEHVAISTI